MEEKKNCCLWLFLFQRQKQLSQIFSLKVNSEAFSTKMYFSLDVSLWTQLVNVSSRASVFAVSCFSSAWPRLVLLDCRICWDMLKSWNKSRGQCPRAGLVKEKPGRARRAPPERRAGCQFHIKQKFYSRRCTMHSPRGFLEVFAASPRAFLSGSGLTVFLLVIASNMAWWLKLWV